MIKSTGKIWTGLLLLFVCVIALSFSVQAQAQTQAEEKVSRLNKKAMVAFRKKKVDVAISRLQKALKTCTKHDIRGRQLAKTLLIMGVVEAEGNGNKALAMEHFKSAVCEDKKISFKQVKVKAKAKTKKTFRIVKKNAKKPGQCPDDPAQGEGPDSSAGAGHLPPGAVTDTDLLFHESVAEQQSNAPVPIYVEVKTSTPIDQIILYYRTMGERIFQKVPMTPHEEGFAATIGCDVMQTFNPSGIEYYIGVTDQGNRLLGTSGTEARPHMISIVEKLSGDPPALPNLDPPKMCGAECFPWDESCNESDGSDGGRGDSTLRVGLTIGTGLGILPGTTANPYNQVSRTPDHVTSTDRSAITTNTSTAWNKFNIRASAMLYLSPKMLVGISFRGGLALDRSGSDEVMQIAPTFLANMAFRLVGEESSKFELGARVGLGGGVIQYRVPYNDCAEYVINDPDNVNFQNTEHPWYDASNADQFQTGCHENAIDSETNAWEPGSGYDSENVYFRRAGNLVGEIGLDSYIWFESGLGLNIGVISDVYFVPDFALNFDLQIGPVFRF